MKGERPPQRWEPVRLGDILRRHNEINHPGDHEGGHAIFVGLEHIEAQTGRRLGSSILDLANLSGRKPTFRRGQIVYGYLRPYLNKVWIADLDGCSSVDQFAFDVNENLACTPFVAAFMRSGIFLQRAQGVTTTGQLPRISIDEIMNVEIELPPLMEQERISGCLTEQLAAVEHARTAAQCRLAAASALSAAHFRDFFEGPESSAWKMVRLGDICEGTGQYGTSVRSNNRQDGLPVLGMPHIHQGRIRWRNVSFVVLPPKEVEKYRLQIGDLLFNRTNSAELVGKTAVFDGAQDAVFASYLIRFRLRKGVADPYFVSAFINSRKGRTFIEQRMARAAGQVNISASTMAEMPIPCPSIDVQRRIAEHLARVVFGEADRLTEVIRDELAAIEALPAALMREAFQLAI